jgi:RNA polymerase sigma-70 factor (ECF subfamily)
VLDRRHRHATADIPAGDLARRIAAAVPGGAAEAEAALYRRFAPRVRRFGLRHLGDPQAADDLVHEVILQTLDGLRTGRVRDPDRVGSFVLGSCRMAVRNRLRADRRRERLLLQWGGPGEPDDGRDEDLVDRDRLEHCLNALGERERTVLVLTFYAERSGEEISRELTLSSGNVRVIRHRALTALARCLQQGGTMR